MKLTLVTTRIELIAVWSCSKCNSLNTVTRDEGCTTCGA